MRRLTSSLTRAGYVLHRHNLAERALELPPFRYEYQLRRLDRRLAQATTALSGAKLLLRQLMRYTDFVRFFTRYRNARFILLTRASPVDAICSLQVAQRTQLYHSAQVQHDNLAPFAIDPHWAAERIRSQLLYQSMVMTCLRTLNATFITITYEHLMCNTSVALERIALFLGINHIHTRSPLRKLVLQPYRHIIINYEELVMLNADIENEMTIHPLESLLRE